MNRRRAAVWVLRGLGLLLLCASLGSLGWRGYRARAGEPSDRLADRWNEGHRLLARDGRLLRELPSELGQRGQPLPLEAIGDRLVIATIVAEDQRFYEHSGFDARATLRAVMQNVRHLRVVSGASTISQQLVKLLDNGGVSPAERSLVMKLDEAARAQNLEREMTKQAILTAYLNRLPYGHGWVGPAAAAHGMFGVPPAQLSWSQAALLAVLPRAPSYLDPYRHRERSVARQRNLLRLLHEGGWLSTDDYQRALDEPLSLIEVNQPFEAAHLTEALRLHRLDRFGAMTASASASRTTIDLDLQREAEGLLSTHVERVRERGVRNGAVIVADNRSGEVLVYLGGVNWHDPAIAGQLDMARAPRQPGSTLKPLLYAMAFERGLSPAEALPDVPTAFGEADGAYAPNNFDHAFIGPVSAREALAGSLNVPAVGLAARLPAGALLSRLQAAGLRSLDQPSSHYGLALALGSGEVSLIELTEAYLALARGGERVGLRLTAASQTTSAGNEAAPDASASGTRIFQAGAVAAVTDSLSDPLARIRGLGSRGPFDLGFPVAVKTGTSSGYRDSWTVGYTREYTVAVWMGNADGRPARELTGGAGAGPLFADVMRLVMRRVRVPAQLIDPELLEPVAVCPLSGHPAGDACPEAVMRRLPKDALALHRDAASCSFHRRALAQAGGYACSAAGRVVVALPDAYSDWLAAQPAGAPGRDPDGFSWVAASQMSGCAQSSSRASLQIVEPGAGSVLVKVADVPAEQQRVALAARYRGPADQAPVRVEFLIDGVVIGASTAPYRLSAELVRGDHELTVRPASRTRPLAPARSLFAVR